MVGLMLATLAANYVPEPQPCSADLIVGSYYFPGHFSPMRWMPFRRCGYPTPVLGFYRDYEPEVLDWHIKWAVEHGISFFAFDWYGGPKGPSEVHNQALDRAFLTARYRSLMKFCLMWCNEGIEERYTEDEMVAFARLLTERYFSQPNYLKIDGDNVLIISVPGHLLASFGAEGTGRVFARMAEVSRAAGCGGLFPVAKQHDNQDALKRAGFRATTGYNYPEAGMSEAERMVGRGPAETMVDGYEEIWRQATRQGNLPYIVPVCPGWDARPWYLDAALVRTNPRAEYFRRMCLNARRYVDPKLRMVIAECWNEFGEGSYIEPTLQTGFGYLDAMRDAFCSENPHHADITPQSLGRPVPTFRWDEIPAASAEELLALGTDMLYNGGFEAPWGWVGYHGEGPWLVDEAHSGNRAMAVGGGRGVKAEWLMPIPDSRKATVQAWVRVPEGASLKVLAALFRGNAWVGRYVTVDEVGYTGGEWRPLEKEVSFEDAEATHFDVEFVAAGGTCLVDDVAAVPSPGERPEKPLPPGVKSAAERMAAGENMLYNGDMETDWGWVLYDNKTAASFSDDAQSGQRSLRVPDGDGVKSLWLMPLPASRRVRIEYWARVPKGASLAVVCALFRNGVWLGRHARAGAVIGSGDQWEHRTVVVRVEDPFAAELDVEFVARGGECLVDNVAVHSAD